MGKPYKAVQRNFMYFTIKVIQMTDQRFKNHFTFCQQYFINQFRNLYKRFFKKHRENKKVTINFLAIQSIFVQASHNSVLKTKQLKQQKVKQQISDLFTKICNQFEILNSAIEKKFDKIYKEIVRRQKNQILGKSPKKYKLKKLRELYLFKHLFLCGLDKINSQKIKKNYFKHIMKNNKHDFDHSIVEKFQQFVFLKNSVSEHEQNMMQEEFIDSQGIYNENSQSDALSSMQRYEINSNQANSNPIFLFDSRYNQSSGLYLFRPTDSSPSLMQ